MEESQQVHLSSLQALISLLLGVGPTIFLTTLELESRQVGMQVADEERERERRKEKKAFAFTLFVCVLHTFSSRR